MILHENFTQAIPIVWLQTNVSKKRFYFRTSNLLMNAMLFTLPILGIKLIYLPDMRIFAYVRSVVLKD